uniref:Ig-like domain-containing protein n=1 Tax=Poecilia mexicana TaxID=48701 RepID=A0A3B3YRE2_9TELE
LPLIVQSAASSSLWLQGLMGALVPLLETTSGQSVSISCGTGQCGTNYVYWYQKKDTETFRFKTVSLIHSVYRFLTLKCVDDLKYFSFCLFLLCSGRKVVPPEVTVCPVKTKDRVEGNTALMCLASGMYPPPAQISWKRQKGSKEEPAPAEEKQQEISGSRSSAIIRLVKNETLYNYDYICEVQHEGGKVTNQTRFKGTKSRSSGEIAALKTNIPQCL